MEIYFHITEKKKIIMCHAEEYNANLHSFRQGILATQNKTIIKSENVKGMNTKYLIIPFEWAINLGLWEIY